MIPLLPSPPPEIEQPLHHVLTRAMTATGYRPPWIVVEDDQGQWVREVAARCPCERPRAVVALSSEEALADAVRLGIGGALWLPPSTAGMQDAFAAAERNAADCGGRSDERVVETLSRNHERLMVVTWKDRRFWRRHVGERVLIRKLVLLAEACGVAPAVLPWPLLLVGDHREDEIREAAGRVDEPLPELLCLHLPARSEREEGTVEALRAVVKTENGETPRSPSTLPPQPVYELPGGRLVGRWQGGSDEAVPPPGEWIARPVVHTPDGFCWRLQTRGAPDQWIEDIVSVEQLERQAGGHARLSGWVAQGASPGSPAGLLIQRLVERARRLAVTLWFPHVDSSILQLLMRQQGVTLWVDGPAVPRSS